MKNNLTPGKGIRLLIEQLLFQLNRELGTTLILVTHDHTLAEQCQRHFELLDGQLIEHPRTGG